MSYIGIDIGTSACKMLLVDCQGGIIKSVSKPYPLYSSQDGFFEQNPEDWFEAVSLGMKELLCDYDATQVKALSVSGQMHSPVVLDQDNRVIRPAILWNDTRSYKETDFLNQKIGEKALLEYTSNIAFAGFTAPKLLWMQNNEPELFQKIKKIMLPKDYVIYRLTGNFVTDASDASGTLLYDVRRREWSEDMLKICHLERGMLPKVYKSYDVIGTLRHDVATKLGLRQNVAVAAGAADNAGAALGNACLSEGECSISLGTSGTILIPHRHTNLLIPQLHSFAHANDMNYFMGVVLSGASCNAWWQNNIIGTKDYKTEESNITVQQLGKNDVLFLPYLVGERCPINDTQVRGMFIGLSQATCRSHMTQAVLEGVAFALKQNLDCARTAGLQVLSSTVCGGGAKSTLWKTILCNVLDLPIQSVQIEEGCSYGSAMLAATACGDYSSIDECVNHFVKIKDCQMPNRELTELYQEKYQKYITLYPIVREYYLSK